MKLPFRINHSYKKLIKRINYGTFRCYPKVATNCDYLLNNSYSQLKIHKANNFYLWSNEDIFFALKIISPTVLEPICDANEIAKIIFEE